MDNIYIGKIVGYHGIKGELKIVSDFEKVSVALKKGNEILIENEAYTITSEKVYKNNYLITINDMYDLNLVEKFIKKDIYIKRKFLCLKDNEYLLNDLIDFKVYDENDFIGNVVNVVYSKAYNLLVVSSEKKFYIPLINEYIKDVDLNEKKIYTINGKDLII